MRNNQFLKRLTKEIPTWVERGWVHPDQQHAIFDHVASQASGGSRYLTLVFALMGVLLFGAGVITFFAANWRELSKLAKLVILFGAMWLAYYFRHIAAWIECVVALMCENVSLLCDEVACRVTVPATRSSTIGEWQ